MPYKTSGFDAGMDMGDEHLGFEKLKQELSHEKGIHDPGALAAHIGMEKMGKKAFEAKAHGDADMEVDNEMNQVMPDLEGEPAPPVESDMHPIGVTSVRQNRGWNDSVTNMEMTAPPVGNLGNPINNGDMDLPWEVNPEQSFAEAEVGFNNPRGDGSKGMLNEGTMKAQPMTLEDDSAGGRAWSADEINRMNDSPVPAGQLNWASGDYQFLPEAPSEMVREVTAIDSQDRWGR